MDANSTIPKNSPKPGGGPAAVAPASRAQAVEFFIETVAELYEKDYGDFMRRVVLYMDRMAMDVRGAPPEVVKIFTSMKQYLVYQPNFDIESTRVRILRDAQEIARRLK